MKLPAPIHRWALTPKAAIRLQRQLADRVRIEPLKRDPKVVAGADMAISPDGKRCVAGVVVWDIEKGEVIEQTLAWREVQFPYVPGLLSFREAPAVLAAVRKLRVTPEVLILDAQGLAHPRRLGLASHVGLLMDHPTVGCAKSRLCGTHEDPPDKPGRFAALIHADETVGSVLRTRSGVKPVYVSVGHRVTLDDAVRVVMSCVGRFRLCEPTRQAHILVTRHRTDGL